MAIFIINEDDLDDPGPSREQLEDQVEHLAEVLRSVYEWLPEGPEWGDTRAAIEDLFSELELEL